MVWRREETGRGSDRSRGMAPFVCISDHSKIGQI